MFLVLVCQLFFLENLMTHLKFKGTLKKKKPQIRQITQIFLYPV